MTQDPIHDCDRLRTLANIGLPDPRSSTFGRCVDGMDHFHPENQRHLQQRIDRLNAFELEPAVPASIRVQFETAKNLYLYAWFVYRFYPIVDQHLLSTLEFGLRERFESEIPPNPDPRKGSKYRNRDGRVDLRKIMRYVVDHRHITNEDFAIWWHRAEMNAKHRRDLELIAQLSEDRPSIEYDEDDFTIEAKDSAWDYVNELKDNLPNRRNSHAHGSKMLYKSGLGLFETTSTILNKVYSTKPAGLSVEQ